MLYLLIFFQDVLANMEFITEFKCVLQELNILFLYNCDKIVMHLSPSYENTMFFLWNAAFMQTWYRAQ